MLAISQDCQSRQDFTYALSPGAPEPGKNEAYKHILAA